MKEKNEALKVKEYLGIVVEIKSEDNAITQRKAIENHFKTPGVQKIIYQRRTADKILIIPEREIPRRSIMVKK